MFNVVYVFFVTLILAGCGGSSGTGDVNDYSEQTRNLALSAMLDNEWIGDGIAYSPYRDGQAPGSSPLPSEAEILEDLNIIKERWKLIRLYGADEVSVRVLTVIQNNNLPIKVLQGAWIENATTSVDNEAQLSKMIELANTYSDVVVAVNIGNEMSLRNSPSTNTILNYIQTTKQSISQPVSVNDVYAYWNNNQAQDIANAVDFIGVHLYAYWDNQPINNALNYTQTLFSQIQNRYPNKQIVIGEAGWPSADNNERMGIANLENQKTFFDDYSAWIDQQQIVSFYFEAFDEKWKSQASGFEVEEHWGLYYSNRLPKLAVID